MPEFKSISLCSDNKFTCKIYNNRRNTGYALFIKNRPVCTFWPEMNGRLVIYNS